jgi:hypothetical protein
MKRWVIRFSYDGTKDDIMFGTFEAEGPDEAVALSLSANWKYVDKTRDEALVCYHYRMKDANVTLYVYEDLG